MTQEELKQLLHYNPDTGIFTWRTFGRMGRARFNKRAGTFHKGDLYRYISIDKTIYSEHRLAWLYMTGYWPKEEIDHKNRIRDDNCWSNLREVTHIQNCRNGSIRGNNTSGVTGVDLRINKRGNTWRATIRIRGLKTHLGTFKTLEEAKHAYQAASIQLEELDQ